MIPKSCQHCSAPIHGGRDLSLFCCVGCQVVYGILESRGLSRYYDLKKGGANIRQPLPVTIARSNYGFLDDPEFLRLYTDDDGRRIQFYLEGVHCAACVWLIEKLPDFLPEVESSRLNLGEAVATVTLRHSGGFSSVAREIQQLGYRPHPVKDGNTAPHRKLENRTLLIRVGVAAAATGNIMLLAICLYGGLTGPLAGLFRWVSFALFLPVFFFSALPFYKNAWTAIRTRTMSIDVPIALGIILGGLASLVNLVTGSEAIYFDSLSALVFLLLGSRFLLRRAQQMALSSAGLMHFLTPSIVRKQDPLTREIQETSMDFIKTGHVVEVRAGESIPVDGVIIEGSSKVNCALLTGESALVSVDVGVHVFAGTTNEQAPLLIEVNTSGANTRLGKILKATEENMLRKAPLVALADRASRIFVSVVIGLAFCAFFWGLWHAGLQHGINLALAMVIVTCPCALALATPLAMSLAMSRAARLGILIKGADVVEKLTRIESVYLDKTGTLTEGSFEVLNWVSHIETLDEHDPEIIRAVVALESRSNHPIAKALVSYFKAGKPLAIPDVENFRETIGQGVQGQIGQYTYELKQAEYQPETGTCVGLYRDQALIGRAILGDRVRKDAAKAIETFTKMGIRPYILSGDNRSAVVAVAHAIGVSVKDITAGATPEMKSQLIQLHPRALMVGDGANDAVALASASVGVAVHGGMEVSMRAADVFIQQPGVGSVCQLIEIARETMKILRRNIIFSIIYNVAGVLAVMTGAVSPLFAAILMPLSALTVYFSSVYGTRALRRTLSGPFRPTSARKYS